MTDDKLRGLNIDDLLYGVVGPDFDGGKRIAEVDRRLKAGAVALVALWEIRKTPVMPFPDRYAHSEHAFADAVWVAWSRIQQIAATALNEPR